MPNSLAKVLCLAIALILIEDNCYCGSSESKIEFSYASDLKRAIENDDFNAIAINRNCSGIIGQPSTDIDLIFKKVEESIVLSKWTFIVFSETFFGNTPVINHDTVCKIVTTCNNFSKKHPNVFIHINFLHTFHNKNRPPWLPERGIDTADIHPNRIICAGTTFENDAAKVAIFKYNDRKDNRISNYSLLIWNEKPIVFYRKSTYCNEANASVIKYEPTSQKLQAGDYLYEFGDFRENAVDGLTGDYKAIADTLLRDGFFKTRICYDLNEMAGFDSSTKILIINANEAPSIYGWKDKINSDMFCIEADPYHQNPTLQGLQKSAEIRYPYCTYTFFNKDGRFLPRQYGHSLNDVLPFYVYLGSNGFEIFSDDD